MNKKIISVFAVICLLICMAIPVSAQESAWDLPYESYSYNNSDQPVTLPAPYSVGQVITGESVGTVGFSDISGLFYDRIDRLYISDSGNNRIVVTDENFVCRQIIDGFVLNGKKDTFQSPQGVFADKKAVYIADSSNGRIVVLNREDFSLVRLIEKPEISLLDKDYNFIPTDLVVDNAGRIYVISSGINQGLICLDEKGSFLSFLGAPQVVPNVAEQIWRKIASKKQLEKMQRYVPTEYNSVLIDSYGFIYCSSQSTEATPVAKLNSEGKNVLYPLVSEMEYGDLSYDEDLAPRFSDIALDENDSYYLLDSKYGKIYTYSADGYLMYVFGGTGLQKGVFLSASAITVMGNRLIVADRMKATVTAFTLSDFGSDINHALTAYDSGAYDQAEEYWEKVYNAASCYVLAVVGLAKIDIQRGDFDAAMQKLKPIHERKLYAKVFEKKRDEIIRNSWVLFGIILFVIVLVVGFVLLKKSQKYKSLQKKDTVVKLRYSRYVIFHPFDGFWDIKHENKGNLATAVILFVLFTLCYAVRSQFSGYVVTGTVSSEVNALYQTAMILLPLLFWVVSNWCFTALMDGEGSMKDIFIATSYSLTPYILFSLPLFLASHVLTEQEAAFYTVADTICVVWVLLLLFFGMMTTHSYSLSKSLLTTVLTLVGICLIIFILLLLANIIQQVVSYFYSIYQELLFRTY